MSFYIDVFREAAFVSSPIPFAHEPTFFAMRSFGGYNMLIAAAFAVAGSALGAAFSFILGYGSFKLYQKKGNKNYLTIEKYNAASRSFRRCFLILLPFTWLPLLNLLVFVAGFLGIRAKLVFPLVIAGKTAYYCWYILPV